MLGLSKDWEKLLLTEQLALILEEIEKKDICPPYHKIFEFARLTDIKSVKVIILGQDPYPSEHAHGLAFSSKDSKTPASLRNIFTALIHSGEMDEMPSTNDLTCWAKQGVLLINSYLTTLRGSPKAHKSLWSSYTKELFCRISEYLLQNNRQVGVFLWGREAESYKNCFTGHLIYTWCHPSPLAAVPETKRFKYCDHFTQINKELGEQKICWKVVPVPAATPRVYGKTYPEGYVAKIEHEGKVFIMTGHLSEQNKDKGMRLVVSNTLKFLDVKKIDLVTDELISHPSINLIKESVSLPGDHITEIEVGFCEITEVSDRHPCDSHDLDRRPEYIC